MNHRQNSYINSILILTLILFSCYSLSASDEKVTVIYPDVKPPYDKIFSQIMNGIESELDSSIVKLKLPRSFDKTEIVESISTKKVIALGKRGFSIAKEVYKEKLVVVGALPISPNVLSGVSLMASPQALFDSLNELAPQVKIITVVYSKSSAWIMDEANIEAKKRGLTLNAVSVDDLKSAVRTYNSLFENAENENMAIWLPLDPITANEKIIVPTILEKAWDKKIVVFSSKPTHAKRGALFSALPDNEALGQQLATLMKSASRKDATSVVKPLSTIKLAVNLRTAAHLGYNYQPSDVSDFALTFPK